MSNKKLDAEAREQKRLERLGTNNPFCVICEEDDSRVLELHHLADHGIDPTTVILCRNCHRKASDSQADHPDHGPVSDQLMEQIGRFLRGLADLFILLAEKLIGFSEALIARAASQAECVQ